MAPILINNFAELVAQEAKCFFIKNKNLAFSGTIPCESAYNICLFLLILP